MGLSPGSSRTGLTVRTVLANPSTRPGLALPGRVLVTAGRADVPVLHVRLGLVTSAEPDDPEAPRQLVQFHQAEISGGFVLRAGRVRSIPFRFPVPWETPVTVVGGMPLLSLRMGLRTEVAIEPRSDQGAMLPLFVHPLTTQAYVLAALDSLGFSLRQAGSVAARLPGVAQTLSLHQRLGYWVAPLYAGPITELEVIFIADSAGLEVLLWCDGGWRWRGSRTRASAGSRSGMPPPSDRTGWRSWTGGCEWRSTGTRRRWRTPTGRPRSTSPST